MFPLSDENPTERVPVFTAGLILLCLAAWFLVQGAGADPAVLQASVCTFGLIPLEVTGPGGLGWVEGGSGQGVCRLGGLGWEGALTSMFMHGGWGHLIGNLWFLWVFGNNVEDSMGHLRFVLFYGLCGLGAAAAQVMSEPGSVLPMVGASGAISGVMGAYAVLYPRARVNTLLFFIVFIRIVPLPAWFMLGYWFLLQLLGGSLGGPGGTAFWAHIGGFVAGVLLVKPFEKEALVRARRDHGRLSEAGLGDRGRW